MTYQFNAIRYINKDSKSTEEFLQSKANHFLLSMPEIKEATPYRKAVSECLVNQLAEFTQSLSKNERHEDYGKHPADRCSEEGIPMEMLHQFREISNIMQYMINCTSWRSDKYHAFDAMEIQARLSRAAAMSNIALKRD